jgi:hypothetical protein
VRIATDKLDTPAVISWFHVHVIANMVQNETLALMQQIRDIIKDNVPENMRYFTTDEWMANIVDLYNSNEAPIAMDSFLSNLDDSGADVPRQLLERLLTTAKLLVVGSEMPEDKFEALSQRLRGYSKSE